MKRMILCGCIAALLVSCEPEVTYEDVDQPVYKAEIFYGTAIASRADLEKIGTEDYPLNGVYYLAEDIDLSGDLWTPLGPDKATPFSGVLNGNGKTLKGLTLQGGEAEAIGLFGYLVLAQVSNLTVELGNNLNTSIELTSENNQYIGVVAGYAENSLIAEVQIHAGEGKGLNIKKVAESPYNDFFVGGALGYGNTGTEIRNLKADLSLTFTSTSNWTAGGGIVGYSVSVVRDCTIAGRVEGTGSAGGNLWVGGIVGNSNTTVENCASTVTLVSGINSGPNPTIYAGGITGTAVSVANSRLIGSNSRIVAQGANTGATNGHIYAGGITGNSNATNSSVTGSVEIQAESLGVQNIYAGGITGQGRVTNSYTLEEVKVRAKANNTGNSTNRKVLAGGIAGVLSGGSIANCFSLSEVTTETALNISLAQTAKTGAGGLVGELLQGGQIENSYAAGPVAILSAHTSNVVFAGGIAGIGYLQNSTIGVKNTVALNSSVRVDSTNFDPTAVHAYRILGGVHTATQIITTDTDIAANTFINLINNYASDDLLIQKKDNTGAWQSIEQGTNDTQRLAGDTNITLDETFFSGTLQWDFTGEEGNPAIWKWDAGLNRPVLNN
jgi:hypothetical protein